MVRNDNKNFRIVKIIKRLVDVCIIWNYSYFNLFLLKGVRIYIKVLFLLYEWKLLIYLYSFLGVFLNFDCIVFFIILIIYFIWGYRWVMFVKYRGSFIFLYYYVFFICKFLKFFKFLN